MTVHLMRSVVRHSSLLSHHLKTAVGKSNAAFSSLPRILALPQTNDGLLTQGQRRALSSEDHASQVLSDLLSRELSEEEENVSAAMPPDLVELKSRIENDWRIVEGEDGATVKLFSKNTSGDKVSVAFHCQDTLDDEPADEYVEEEESAAAVRFTVLVTKAGKTMVLTCLSEEAEARVESVAMTNDDAETVTSKGVDSDLYQGPEYTELAEDLQEAFSAYVNTECGIDSDMAAFISMYSDYKEQVEYVRWLKQVKNMIS